MIGPYARSLIVAWHSWSLGGYVRPEQAIPEDRGDRVIAFLLGIMVPDMVPPQLAQYRATHRQLMAGKVDGVIHDIADAEAQIEHRSRRPEQHPERQPDRAGHDHAHDRRHDVAIAIAGRHVVIAMRQENQPTAKRRCRLQVEDEAVHRIFEQRPDQHTEQDEHDRHREARCPPARIQRKREKHRPCQRERRRRDQRQPLQQVVAKQSDTRRGRPVVHH